LGGSLPEIKARKVVREKTHGNVHGDISQGVGREAPGIHQDNKTEGRWRKLALIGEVPRKEVGEMSSKGVAISGDKKKKWNYHYGSINGSFACIVKVQATNNTY